MSAPRDLPDRPATAPGAENPRRFVVLRHTDRAGVHFDLMIDLGPSLATWKCAAPPEQAAGQAGPLRCRRIGDHRRMYLDYAGPVSGDRGHVEQHDTGVCHVEDTSAAAWDVRFDGVRLRGRFRLEPAGAAGDAYSLRFLGG